MAKNTEQIIIDIFYKLAGKEVLPESRLKQDLGLDSLDFVDAVLQLEKEFNITLPDYSENIQTVQDIIDLVKKNIEK